MFFVLLFFPKFLESTIEYEWLNRSHNNFSVLSYKYGESWERTSIGMKSNKESDEYGYNAVNSVLQTVAGRWERGVSQKTDFDDPWQRKSDRSLIKKLPSLKRIYGCQLLSFLLVLYAAFFRLFLVPISYLWIESTILL